MDATQTRRSRREAGSSRIHHRLGGRLNSNAFAVLCGSDARLQFIHAMHAAGIVPADHDAIIGDGGVHRFHVEGDKPGSRNGWCILHMDGLPAGVFGTWKGGMCGTWRSGRGPMTPAQRARFDAQIETAKRQRAAEIAERHRQAQERARRLWAEAAAPRADHSYLMRKKIKAHGIRQLNGKLIVPMRDGDGVLWNVQTITGDGTKRFLFGGRKRELYHAIGKIEDALLIAEGYATAASLHETTGKPVAVAFDCGNLEPVARVLRAKFPAARITICADNDTGTDGNPGLTKATAAARAVGGLIAVPPAGFNDFNDAATGARP